MSRDYRSLDFATIAAHAGRDPTKQFGAINPPVVRASTILFPTLDMLEHAAATPLEGVRYGRHGTPTTHAFEAAMAALEGAFASVSVPSGLAAVTVALLSLDLAAGDHLLVADNIYTPTRFFCDRALAKIGVATTYFDPLLDAAQIAPLLRPSTRAILLESPGSMTFETIDLAGLIALAKAHDLVTVMDNTWATSIYCPALSLGIDLSVIAATKYIVGHSDAMVGVISCRDATRWEKVKRTAMTYGYHCAPDDCWLALRGLRTLPLRLERHWRTGVQLATWLATRKEVARVLHPALPNDPGHARWKRDFRGASGLFAIILKPTSRAALAAFVDHLELFGMGWSWGGYESLLVPYLRPPIRTARAWQEEGWLVRIHAGLEAVEDLQQDLERAFDRLAAA